MMVDMRNNSIWNLLIVLFLFIFAITIQVFFLNPPILSDQMEYFITAVQFPRLPSNPDIGSMRIGLIIPVAILYRILGYAEITYYTVPLLSTAILSISIFLIGKALFSSRIGFFSALWVLLIPNLVQDYGHLLPDIPATACAAAAFALLIIMWGNQNSKRDFSSRQSQRGSFLVGILFGWSYLIKEYLAILFFLIPLIFWVMKIPWRCLIPIALGMLLMFGMEILVGVVYYQNPLIRFIAATPRETEGEIHRDIWRIINYFSILLIKEGGEGTLFFMGLGIFNTCVWSVKKDSRFIFLLGWILCIYLLFTFTGLLPVLFNWQDTVLMRLHKFRYWVPILPPLVIGGIVALERYLKKISSIFKIPDNYFVNISLMVLIALVSARGFSVIKDDPTFIRNGADHYLELRDFLEERGINHEVIWIDHDNKRAFERILPMYIRNPIGGLIWSGKFKYINTDDLYLRADEIDPGCVIVDRDFMDPDLYPVPKYLIYPPDNWELIFESENQEIAIYNVD